MKTTVQAAIENATSSIEILSGIYWSSLVSNNHDLSVGPKFERHYMRSNNNSVVDRLPDDMLHLVPPQLYQYPPMETFWYTALNFVLANVVILGWAGNGIVVFIFLCTPTLRTPSNLLIVNLAISDFLITCMNVPMIINCWYETWVLGPLMCDIFGVVSSICGCTSIWTMVAIARDRYNAIVIGIAGKPMTTSMAIMRIVIIWIYATCWALLPVTYWHRYVPEGNLTSCGTDFLNPEWSSRSYILTYSVCVYFIPLTTIIYSYWYIVAAVAAHEKGMREQAKKMNVASLRSGEQDSVSAEAKLAKVAITTITLWFFAWTPYLITNYCGIFQLATLTPLSTIWASTFAKTNSCYNPIVYAISHPKFRLALKKKLPCLVFGKVEQPTKTPAEVQSTTSEVQT
ncbi:hypothetical protein HCN44_002428 [Aphidius gifuensis]|uniref:G-protein coupled receptors family 1 profile domain-containing protein n=2 Tax=Aphidius gifuensis TaxID=684658 RepID=A0A835CUT5_APHGI|nr:hypothetical protein HCN44_002428 [Aphidius gifuensis]